MYELTRISAPLTLAQKVAVVPVPEMRRHARISQLDDDRLLAEDIEAAYDFLAGEDGWLGRCCLLDETFAAYVNGPSRNGFRAPMRPLKAVTGIEWLQAGGSYVAVDPTKYYTNTLNGWTTFMQGDYTSPWPYVGAPHGRAYRITFTAGYGTAADIPSPLKKAMRMLVAHWYNQRETTGSEGRSVGKEVLYGLVSLAGRYRIGPDHS